MSSSECDWQMLQLERAERGRRAMCTVNGLVYPKAIDIEYTCGSADDMEFMDYAEDFEPFRVEDFLSEREYWVNHYDTMQAVFAQMQAYSLQWTGCPDGLIERKTMRCDHCYRMNTWCNSHEEKVKAWCKTCPCGCTSLETCYEFPDHGDSLVAHADKMHVVLQQIQDRSSCLCYTFGH